MTGLTQDEARALFVLTTGGAHEDLGLGNAARSAILNVMRLLSFGGDVEVVSPPEVRADLAAVAATVVARYAGPAHERRATRNVPGTVRA